MKTKRINRGLILGAAVIVALGGYILFDELSFKSNKDDIDTSVREYLSEIAKSNISATADGESWKKVIDDNWGYHSFYDSAYQRGEYRTADAVNESITYNMNDTLHTKDFGEITNCTARVQSVSVKKEGPDLAAVTVSYYIDFDARGNVYLFGGDYPMNVMMESDSDTDFSEAGFANDKVKDIEYKGTIFFPDVSLKMSREDGQWKIVADGFGGDVTSTQLFEKNGEPLDIAAHLGLDKSMKQDGGDGNA